MSAAEFDSSKYLNVKRFQNGPNVVLAFITETDSTDF